jgi:hypothetical protein
MPRRRNETAVAEFLRDALARDDVGVPKLESMARAAGLLGEDQLITHAKLFRRRMHHPIPQQGKWLGYVVRGYFNYHAVPMNFRSLAVFRVEVAKRWRRVLSRRSQRGNLNWAQMNQLMNEWLPRPRILHPWPSLSIAVRDSR